MRVPCGERAVKLGEPLSKIEIKGRAILTVTLAIVITPLINAPMTRYEERSGVNVTKCRVISNAERLVNNNFLVDYRAARNYHGGREACYSVIR